MRTTLITAAALVTLVGVANAETRNLVGFTGVSAADRIRVEVALGDAYRVEVTGSEADKVTTRIDNDDTLIIRRTNRPFWGGTPAIDATVRVTMPRVSNLASSRGAELTAANINSDEMSLAASMGGELSVSGACETLNVAVSMGGAIRAQDFHCETADIAASMGGDARVFVSDSYDAAASMGGSVNVSGGGRSDNVATSMGGSVDSR
jgi:hypothetical protein